MNKLQQEQVRKLIQQFRAGSLGRRDFLRQVVALGIGSAVTYSLLGQAESKAQVFGTPSTRAVGEEGQPDFGPQVPQATTLMVGEEDLNQPPQVSTRALGEEDPQPGFQPTTERVGEEDLKPPPQVTTFAVGEEDPQPGIQPTTERVGEEGLHQPPQATTQALSLIHI